VPPSVLDVTPGSPGTSGGAVTGGELVTPVRPTQLLKRRWFIYTLAWYAVIRVAWVTLTGPPHRIPSPQPGGDGPTSAHLQPVRGTPGDGPSTLLARPGFNVGGNRNASPGCRPSRGCRGTERRSGRRHTVVRRPLPVLADTVRAVTGISLRMTVSLRPTTSGGSCRPQDRCRRSARRKTRRSALVLRRANRRMTRTGDYRTTAYRRTVCVLSYTTPP